MSLKRLAATALLPWLAALPAMAQQDARAVAKDAFIYGFPVVATYETLYRQAVDRSSTDFVAPFNTLGHSARVATPKDKQFVTPNSDTPYSYIWMDLRAEPLVVTMPKIEKGRYYSAQLIDLYTHNFGYLGSRMYSNDGGDFLIAGPDWKGEAPKGIKAVIRSETQLAYALFRTQMFNPSDLMNVQAIQAKYGVRTLSRYLGASTSPTAPAIAWPKPVDDMVKSPALFSYLNFLLQFCPQHPTEKAMLDRFASLGIGAGQTFDATKLPAETAQAVNAGVADAWAAQTDRRDRMVKGEFSLFDIFGDRAFMSGDYLRRFVAAVLGIFGNSKEEALYPNYFRDSQNAFLDASLHRYTLRFEKGQLPPTDAFWSLTMYDGKSKLLVDNPLNRYLINSPMTKSFKTGADGSVTLYIQKNSPGKELEANWLPAPDGPFYSIMRIYLPMPEVLDGRWKLPAMVRVGATGSTASGKLPINGSVDTAIGRLSFEAGYPTSDTVKHLYDQIDLQRGAQAYLWSLPLMGFAQWQEQHRAVFGTGETDIVLYESYRDKLGLLTANATTPYAIGFIDLAKTGPLVVDVPPGPIAGGLSDLWQLGFNGEFGEGGPDKGQGGRLLVLGPDHEAMEPDGYRVVRSPTFSFFVGLRVLSTDPKVNQGLFANFKLYPYKDRANPPATRYVRPEGRQWSGTQPRGMAYWELLARTVNAEPVRPQDRYFMAMLKELGIQKGASFNPDARQKRILEESALIGEAMVRAIAYQKRFAQALIWPDRHWELSLAFQPASEPASMVPMDEYASWFYEAVTAAKSMASKTPGVGQAYLEATRDLEGHWLDGGKNYRLRVGPDVPVKQFWSVTLYDNETRCFIDNPHEIADRSSRMDLLKNADGSVDLYFGPKPPAGKEKNWIPTVPGKGWFTYFRLYAPTEAYMDRSWKLADIELLK